MKVDLEYRNIVVPVDFSDTSRLAFYVALRYARMFDAETWVVHVMEPIRKFGDENVEQATNEVTRLEDGVRRRIDELFEEGGLREVDRRKVHVTFKAGDVVEEILAATMEHRADLLVMGYSVEKRKGLMKIMSGNPTEKVAEKAACHVLMVKPEDYEYVPEGKP
jgi:nucleotide-binding universal stress UspA family protein